MKKYYFISLIVNLIPILTTYIILHDCSSDGCMGKYLVWFIIPIWAIIYSVYFIFKEDQENYIKKLIIYFPTISTSIIGISLVIINDGEIIWFLYAFLVLLLPSFIYNIIIDYKLNSGINKKVKKQSYILHPITLLIIIFSLISIFYRPSFYDKDVFSIGSIDIKPSINNIQIYLSDSTKNEYLLPDSIEVLPHPDYKNWMDEDDYFLYFNDNPRELIHIHIIDWTDNGCVEIKGIKTLKEKYKWQWRVMVKKNDPEAIRVLNRVEKVLKEIDSNIKTKIKVDNSL